MASGQAAISRGRLSREVLKLRDTLSGDIFDFSQWATDGFCFVLDSFVLSCEKTDGNYKLRDFDYNKR